MTYEYENRYHTEGYTVICGVDEAGRGPLAGPVGAAACILPKDLFLWYLNDSKKVTERRREVLFDEIRENAVAFGIGSAPPEEIDRINILQATYQAMREAVEALSVPPELCLVDAVTIPRLDVPQLAIIHGDAKSVSIAAASILAKVTRDRLMLEADERYPEYGFAAHKGYGTKAHIEALQKYGPCPIHRRSFIGHFV